MYRGCYLKPRPDSGLDCLICAIFDLERFAGKLENRGLVLVLGLLVMSRPNFLKLTPGLHGTNPST